MADRDRTTNEEIGRENEEMIRGIAEEGDDEFEDTEDLDEEEAEDDGSI
jgi:hypothetical protein